MRHRLSGNVIRARRRQLHRRLHTFRQNRLPYGLYQRLQPPLIRLRELAQVRAAYSEHADLSQCFQTTCRLLQSESLGAALGIPPLNGDLFDPTFTPDLGTVRLSNAEFRGMLWQLSMYQENERSPWRRVNYSALDVEELGSVYESLLDFHPVFRQQGGPISFDLVFGTERKSTGSYYTAHGLVQELIKSALEPVMEERLRQAAQIPKSDEIRNPKSAIVKRKPCFLSRSAIRPPAAGISSWRPHGGWGRSWPGLAPAGMNLRLNRSAPPSAM